MFFQCAIPHLSDTEQICHNNECGGKFKKNMIQESKLTG